MSSITFSERRVLGVLVRLSIKGRRGLGPNGSSVSPNAGGSSSIFKVSTRGGLGRTASCCRGRTTKSRRTKGGRPAFQGAKGNKGQPAGVAGRGGVLDTTTSAISVAARRHDARRGQVFSGNTTVSTHTGLSDAICGSYR